MVVAGPVSFCGLPHFFGAWPTEDRFAGKLADGAGIAIRRYSSNKWIPLFVSSKVTAVQAEIHLLSGLQIRYSL